MYILPYKAVSQLVFVNTILMGVCIEEERLYITLTGTIVKNKLILIRDEYFNYIRTSSSPVSLSLGQEYPQIMIGQQL